MIKTIWFFLKAYFYIFGNLLDINVTIANIYLLNYFLVKILRLKNPQNTQVLPFWNQNSIFGNFSKKQKKSLMGSPHEAWCFYFWKKNPPHNLLSNLCNCFL